MFRFILLRLDQCMTGKDKNAKAIEDLITAGSGIAGAAAAGAVGFLTGGPAGAALAASLGPLISHTLSEVATEIKDRVLGKREEARIGATIAFATKKIQENRDSGKKVRQDDFFAIPLGDRAAAEEIFEGVLIAAQREHEEKKLKFFGNLLANIAFHPEIDRPLAEVLISAAEAITYRQIGLLALFGLQETGGFELRKRDYHGCEVDNSLFVLLLEMYDLYTRGLVNCSGAGLIDPLLLIPSQMRLQGPGQILFGLMELSELDAEDLKALALLLR